MPDECMVSSFESSTPCVHGLASNWDNVARLRAVCMFQSAAVCWCAGWFQRLSHDAAASRAFCQGLLVWTQAVRGEQTIAKDNETT